jgi:hypothetical protein
MGGGGSCVPACTFHALGSRHARVPIAYHQRRRRRARRRPHQRGWSRQSSGLSTRASKAGDMTNNQSHHVSIYVQHSAARPTAGTPNMKGDTAAADGRAHIMNDVCGCMSATQFVHGDRSLTHDVHQLVGVHQVRVRVPTIEVLHTKTALPINQAHSTQPHKRCSTKTSKVMVRRTSC